MNTDRELVEMAGKAAAIAGPWTEMNQMIEPAYSEGISIGFGSSLWNPLTDDGDALRLAVALDIHVPRFESMTSARRLFDEWGCDERDDGDQYAATRRAIVRAAAEIGRTRA